MKYFIMVPLFLNILLGASGHCHSGSDSEHCGSRESHAHTELIIDECHIPSETDEGKNSDDEGHCLCQITHPSIVYLNNKNDLMVLPFIPISDTYPTYLVQGVSDYHTRLIRPPIS